jgi:putative ABC transport system permease protein
MLEPALRLGPSSLAAAALLLLLPLAVIHAAGLPLRRQLLGGALRMVLQLAGLGLVLEVLFRSNHWALTLGWFLLMIAAAAHSILARTGISLPGLPPLLVAALAAAGGGTLAFVLLAVVRPEPLHQAQYLIPLGGMILGNSMNGTTLALERFVSGLRSPEGAREWETLIGLGATPAQARRPFLQRSLKAALLPSLNTLATMGLVSIPGMMTGQLLAGSPPATAIAYQAVILLAIVAAVSLSSLLVILIAARLLIDRDGLLREPG